MIGNRRQNLPLVEGWDNSGGCQSADALARFYAVAQKILVRVEKIARPPAVRHHSCQRFIRMDNQAGQISDAYDWVYFVSDQGFEVRGTPLHPWRFEVIFEMASPGIAQGP